MHAVLKPIIRTSPFSLRSAQVLKFSSTGKLLMEVGTKLQPGSDHTHFCKPTKVAIMRCVSGCVPLLASIEGACPCLAGALALEMRTICKSGQSLLVPFSFSLCEGSPFNPNAHLLQCRSLLMPAGMARSLSLMATATAALSSSARTANTLGKQLSRTARWEDWR